MQPTTLERVTEATPEGTPVTVVRDNGTLLRTRTRSPVWRERGELVVMVSGIAGYYLAERVHVEPAAAPHLASALSALRDEAELLEQWARQSEVGGWSTTLSKAQRLRADVLRRLVATLEKPGGATDGR